MVNKCTACGAMIPESNQMRKDCILDGSEALFEQLTNPDLLERALSILVNHRPSVYQKKLEAIKELLEKEKRKINELWIPTADHRPAQEDASSTGMVLAVKGQGAEAFVTVVKWSYCTPRAYPYWTRYPRLPRELEARSDA